MTVNQEIAKNILGKVMTPGKRYFVKDLQDLFRSNYSEWVDADFDTNNAIGEAWEMHVKNCVRLSPCRPPRGMNSWPELNCERDGRKWSYWIEATEGAYEASREILPRTSERKRPKPNDGWNAEQFVKRDLEDRGFTVLDVSGGGFGCDLIAIKDERTLRIEVKSSIGPCHPSLTDSEWQTAIRFGDDYILAILDNFEPEGGGDQSVHYLSNPSSLDDSTRVPPNVGHYTTTRHVIHRHAWTDAIGLSDVLYGPPQDGANKCLFEHHSELRFFDLNPDSLTVDVLMECEDESCGRKWMTTVQLETLPDDWLPEEEDACLNRPEGICTLGSAEFNENDIEASCSNCGYRIWAGYVGDSYWQRVR